MNKIEKKKIDLLIHSIGLKYNMSDQEIKEIVESPYEFTHEQIKDLDLSEVTTEEELAEKKTTFLFKALGRIYINFPYLSRRNKQKESGINITKNRWKK